MGKVVIAVPLLTTDSSFVCHSRASDASGAAGGASMRVRELRQDLSGARGIPDWSSTHPLNGMHNPGFRKNPRGELGTRTATLNPEGIRKLRDQWLYRSTSD